MARRKHSSPTLEIRITPEQYESAIRSSSGACLIADAIKRDYPQFSAVMVDMATIRVSDRVAGERYTYLTPQSAQQCLLFFDQGWQSTTDRLIVRHAVKINAITATKATQERRVARRAELVAKRDAGEPMTVREVRDLAVYEKTPPEQQVRPTKQGPSEVGGPASRPVVRGGRRWPKGDPHPNLLRARQRHYGAKIADPGLAFSEAVAAATKVEVERRLSELQ